MNCSAKENRKILKSKTILVGVTGGIAAYKSIELVRRLRDRGASVHVVMTEAAGKFITPLSLEVASQNKVHTSLFEDPLVHIDLPASADLMLVAPATANILAKLAHGVADDLLSTCALAFQGPFIVAPSMNWKMYEHSAVRENLATLKKAGVVQVGPDSGALACGEEGMGRMAEVPVIVEAVEDCLSIKDLSGEKVVVTAGPTREYIDPVRFISNRSSGKMGFALARAAKKRGAEVALVSGPSSLDAPYGVLIEKVESGEEMKKAVSEHLTDATLLIMAAAVADFCPEKKLKTKSEKAGLTNIRLRPVTDIISGVTSKKNKPFVIGFSAETGRLIERAREKRIRKKMDMIIFNDVTEENAGFDVDTNRIIILDGQGEVECDLMTKEEAAEAILDRYLKIKA